MAAGDYSLLTRTVMHEGRFKGTLDRFEQFLRVVFNQSAFPGNTDDYIHTYYGIIKRSYLFYS